MRSLLRILVVVFFGLGITGALAQSDSYRAADEGQRPIGNRISIMPEKFLRGFDPLTVYFPDNRGPGKGPADSGRRLLSIRPDWPGAYSWLDRKTLQFRPAEPWPSLSRFQVSAGGARRVLTTMMSAPTGMSPSAGSDRLKPFRTFTLTFPQALETSSLRKMIQMEVRDQPGLESSPRRRVREWNLAALPRRTHRDSAVYAVTLDREVPEGKQLLVKISLALGDQGKVLWTGRLSTRPPFQVQSVGCGGSELPLRGSAAMPEEMALACGHHGQTPQLVFSAEVRDLTLTALKKLVRLDPAVDDLNFESYGQRVLLKGKFVPEVLYRMSLEASRILDQDGRELSDPGQVEVFFYLGKRQPFVRWKQASAILEAKGPRMIPLFGYGDPRADVRIYRIDPLHQGLWPFPHSPLVVSEESAPPFPGEEPDPTGGTEYVSTGELQAHLRLLGSPLVSRVVNLPLAGRGSATHFGLDVGRLLDKVVARQRPGHYLVGLRRLTGSPQRSYVRVQLTNLSLTSVEERQRVIFYVRSIDRAEPVAGARIVIEAVAEPPRPRPGEKPKPPGIERVSLMTDNQGRAVLGPQPNWRSLHRIHISKDDDTLVLDPRDPPPRFANNHWSPWGQWLHWITEEKIPAPKNDQLLGFVFSERSIYRPGEKVYLKGYLRKKANGTLGDPGSEKLYGMKIQGPGGKEWPLALSHTRLFGFSAEFMEKDVPTGRYTAVLFQRKPYREIARRRFSIEAYRIPTFEVQLVSPVRTQNDEPFKVKAVARYYAGGSVASRPIQWRVTRRPYHYLPKGRQGYLFASSTQFSRGGRVRPPETIREEKTLDLNGSDNLEINPALDMDGSARIYQVEATVTGLDNQQVTATQQTKALPPFLLGMKLKRYYENPRTLKPCVIAVGVDDKSKAGQKVTVRLYRRTWHSHLRETDFASGKASYQTEQQDQKIQELAIRTGKLPVTPALSIEKAGVYVVELVARDKLGRVQTLSADLYVGGKEALAWKKSSQGVFELSTDKKEYRPGEVAKLVIKSPFQKAKALVVIEEPEGNAYVHKTVRGGKAVLPIAIKSSYVPNLPVHVILMRGRLGESAQGDERYRPQTLAASTDILIKPVKNKVCVTVEHPDSVRPGSTVPMTVVLADDGGRPLSGEVTLWLVDEAVLSLAHEDSLDPLTAFIRPNQRRSSIRDTRNKVVGRIQEEEEPAGDGGEDDQEGRLSGKRRVRKNFMTVPYYQATLQVGPSGRLVVPVKMSDDLTNFKVRAVAASGLARFGLFEDRLRVRLPLLVQPQLPRFVRQGDRFWAGGIGRLVEGAEGAGAVAIKVTGLLAEKSFKKKIRLRRNRAESHLFPLTARSADPTRPGQVTVRMDILRSKDRVGDAFEVKLPLLPDRTVTHFAYYQRLSAGTSSLKAFPEKPRQGSGTQDVLVSAAPGMLQLLAALDYVEAYPHGCLEQRMSRLMPQMATGILLRKMGLNDHYALQVGVHVKRLLAELETFQQEEGFLAFWPGGDGKVSLTAQAVRFMHMARRAGVEVPARCFKRALGALKSALRSDFRGLTPDYRYNQQTVAIRALTEVGELDEHYLIGLFHHRKDMDLAALADLSLAMSRHPRLFGTNLSALTADLWDSVVFRLHRGKPVYKGMRWRRAGWTSDYLGSQPASLAAVFESLSILDPRNERLGLLRDALLSHAHATRGFGSTHSSRRAIDALVAYLAFARQEDLDATVSLSAGGRLTLDGGHKVARARMRSDEPMQVTLSGTDQLEAYVRYSYLPEAPGDQAQAVSQGFVVDRTTTVIHKDSSPDSHFEDQPGKRAELKAGDILELHTQVLSRKEHYHVALGVPFAAGLEPLNPELKTSGPEARPSERDSLTPTYVQRLDHEVRYYFTRLPRGTHRFHFRVRATCEGSFVHPAPYAEQMYRQDVMGRGAGMRVVVVGANEGVKK